MRISRLAALTALILTAACYHATIDTGLAPSGQTVTKPWASSFLGGLVPPATIETMAKCPHGVAKVETQLSFLNQVANVITLGIYSPMTIEVQCAASRTAQTPGAKPRTVGVDAAATLQQKQQAVTEAARISAVTGSAVMVVFE